MQELETEGELRQKQQCQDCQEARGLDALTPVGLHQAGVTILGCTHAGATASGIESHSPCLLGGFRRI